MKPLTPRERRLVAMTNGVPDRVPVTPDISNMIPCRLTGKPCWGIYYFGDPPLWLAYLDAVKHFAFDGWFIDGEMQYQCPSSRYRAIEDMQKQGDRWVVRYRGRIDDCRYTNAVTYPVGDPPTDTEKIIKNLEAVWEMDDPGRAARLCPARRFRDHHHTPEANIQAMIDTVEEFGHYPLDIERIQQELRRLN